MARPQKQTVDYFPHDTDASESKTLTIIQAKYGNDGYAFWFKILQLLGKSPGHYFDFNKPADWEFLLAKTHIKDTETAKGILDTLSLLDAIDSELYHQGIIWCQKFVDRIADAYGRTVSGVPQRPKPEVSVTKSGESVSRNPENATEMPQTKVKETKLNNIYIVIFKLWNEQKIIVHKKLTADMKRAIDKVLKDSSLEEVSQAIRNYAEILKGDQYYWSHTWTLKDFLNRGLEKFSLDPAVIRENYLTDKGGQHGTHRKSSRELPPRDKYPKPEDIRT